VSKKDNRYREATPRIFTNNFGSEQEFDKRPISRGFGESDESVLVTATRGALAAGSVSLHIDRTLIALIISATYPVLKAME
jgi:hypothetical protein